MHCAVVITAGLVILAAVVSGKNKWRQDNRCGSKTNPDGEFHSFKAWPSGPTAQCNPDGPLPCCSAYGYCGAYGADSNGYTYCTCPTCEDYRRTTSPESSVPSRPTSSVPSRPTGNNHGSVKVKKWRDDLRCGSKANPNSKFQTFRTPDGAVAECDPDSAKPCCSHWGFCGIDADGAGNEHCTCASCEDYRVLK